MNPAVPAISVRELSRDFGHFQAVKRISFDVAPGEIVGFLGPNGAGKTTTIKMITGLLRITSGSVLIDGLDNVTHLAEVKNKLGYMSQKFSLYPLLTARENIEFFGGISGLAPRELKAGAARMAEQVAPAVLRQKIQDVPPGIRQKVALFVCLLPDPEIILLDEPTLHLDINYQFEVLDLVKRLARDEGLTVVIVSHDLPMVVRYCDRVVLIHDHGVFADGTPDDILTSENMKTVFNIDAVLEYDATLKAKSVKMKGSFSGKV